MPKNGHAAKTQGLYDRIADVQNLAMKLNGYRSSVAKYLKSLDLAICPDSLVLDAGCGTGLVLSRLAPHAKLELNGVTFLQITVDHAGGAGGD